MGRLKKFVIAAAVSAFAWTPSPAGADVVFRATCGSLKGHRVNMDPNGKSNIQKWTPELYSTDTDHIRVKWTSDEQLLPIVFKSETQISVPDVDEFRVRILSLYYRADKVIVTRQTTNPGAVGALLTADYEFVEK